MDDTEGASVGRERECKRVCTEVEQYKEGRVVGETEETDRLTMRLCHIKLISEGLI